MIRSDSLDQLLPALIEARAAMPRISKDQTALVESQRGTSYSYGYADLASILEAVTPALCANDLVVAQGVHVAEGAVLVESTLYHVSGQWLAPEPLAMPLGSSGAQAVGSAATYGRRYALLALLGLAAAGEDDDAVAAGAQARRSRHTWKRSTPTEAKGRPTSEEIAATRERLEQAARRGMEALVAELNTAPQVTAALGIKLIGELKQRAKQADQEIAPT